MKSRYIMHCCGFIQSNRRSWLPIFTIMFFAVMLGMAIVRLVYQARTDSELVIVQDVARISEIMQRIDERCKIIDFDNQKTILDFLTVTKFVGSEVGGMNLAYPEYWEGPYMTKNPSVQGKEYQIVRTKQGYFLVPGDGVVLSNGKVIGKDIVLDEHADMDALMNSEEGFLHKGKSLVVQLPIKKGILHDMMFENLARSDEDLLY